MYGLVNLQASSSKIGPCWYCDFSGQIFPSRQPLVLRQLRLPRGLLPLKSVKSGYGNAAVVAESQPSVLSEYVSSVGSPPPPPALHLSSQWNLTQRHILALNVVACAAAVSATWLFLSSIPTLLAFKRAAESLEKLMDTAREELPDTMAAVRLSGMEISDLTMELSDLGQDITQGVKSSTRAVRVAEERLQSIANMTRPASMQGSMVSQETEHKGPVVAVTARSMRERIVKGRSLFQILLSLARYSGWAFNYLASRKRKQDTRRTSQGSSVI